MVRAYMIYGIEVGFLGRFRRFFHHLEIGMSILLCTLFIIIHRHEGLFQRRDVCGKFPQKCRLLILFDLGSTFLKCRQKFLSLGADDQNIHYCSQIKLQFTFFNC